MTSVLARGGPVPIRSSHATLERDGAGPAQDSGTRSGPPHLQREISVKMLEEETATATGAPAHPRPPPKLPTTPRGCQTKMVTSLPPTTRGFGSRSLALSLSLSRSLSLSHLSLSHLSLSHTHSLGRNHGNGSSGTGGDEGGSYLRLIDLCITQL